MRVKGSLAKIIFVLVGLVLCFLPAEGLAEEFVADSTFYYKTGRQSVILAKFGFNEPEKLKEFPLFFGEWKGTALPISNRPVVKPDFMLERNYRDRSGGSVWFQLIRGRIERAVHVPAICYYNAGWQIVEQGVDSIPVGKQTTPCGRMVLRKRDLYATELYFYLWADPHRDFMKGCVMFRVSSMGPSGGEGERLDLIKKFIQDLFREVGKAP